MILFSLFFIFRFLLKRYIIFCVLPRHVYITCIAILHFYNALFISDSGPKRYDYIDGRWIYKHDGRTLHELLSEEVSQAFKESIDFIQCMNSGDGEDS